MEIDSYGEYKSRARDGEGRIVESDIAQNAAEISVRAGKTETAIREKINRELETIKLVLPNGNMDKVEFANSTEILRRYLRLCEEVVTQRHIQDGAEDREVHEVYVAAKREL